MRELGQSKILNVGIDVESVRKDFPILDTNIDGKPLVYLDNAGTAQKPKAVIQRETEFYTHQNANIHRGIHRLSEIASDEYERARRRIARFFNAARAEEIVFVRGTTEGVNLVANSFGRKYIKEGDHVVVSILEHHSNFIPWQLMAEERGAVFQVIPMDDKGVLDLEAYEAMLSERTKIVALTHISNAIGTVNPVKEMIQLAHARGIPVLIDGAQSTPHMKVDVTDLDCDFFVFSGHKVFGPTGIGVLYGKERWLDEMPPYQVGGGTIRTVTVEKTEFLDPPAKFEGGTPNIGGAIGLATAFDYIEELGMGRIMNYENELYCYAREKLGALPDLVLWGDGSEIAAVLSFGIEGVHSHDISTFLDSEGVAIRAGHHCAKPLMGRLGIPGTARASFCFYNTKEEIDHLVDGILKISKFFS
ncbi:MAG: Cysteine desulfurase [Candidatus Moanabacter tarae]|uniref:Cysteine desulfurase n=1 Tax=Candidatus Moanibacter tarae TaxID=2200854 RepID=A0A2Z4AKU8_9BACT|nr:MAG: Cysteine desulfurase [Candidatus Moanabacter tarae]|tara:strand:+ start:81150 stop:82403 length:1254 start_codon:yes stop_codon:yes gene_type:complete